MKDRQTLDRQVKERLKHWPQHPPGLKMARRGRSVWLRCRPGEDSRTCHPYIKVAGSTRPRAFPDGLWLHFCGTFGDAYVDMFGMM